MVERPPIILSFEMEWNGMESIMCVLARDIGYIDEAMVWAPYRTLLIYCLYIGWLVGL